jgi:hypothetical protein
MAAPATSGNLSVTPVLVQLPAAAGQTTTLTVDNTTAQTLALSATPRPWLQSRSGAIGLDERQRLGSQVTLSPSSFTLAPGAQQQITATVTSVGAAGSLYGGIEVIGVPTGPRHAGITLGARLITSLRLYPLTPRVSLRIGRVVQSGGSLALDVTDDGNALDLLSGSMRLSGPLGGQSASLTPVTLVPGATVALTLLSHRGTLPAGTYALSVSLRQAGNAFKTFTTRVTLH